MEEFLDFISDKLFTEEKPVLFTDLICKFHIGSSKAKETMYAYYKSNRTLKYNCIIICCYRDRIKIVHDVNHLENQEEMVDCFIYAFNPMEEFIPVNLAVDQRESLSIRAPYDLIIPKKEEFPVDAPRTVPSKPAIRSKTVPQTAQPRKRSHSIGLKSTELLAKMKADRENKEAQRQKELAQRRKKEVPDDQNKNDAQMKELQHMFVEDSDNERTPEEHDELNEILDDSAEESLLKQTQDQNREQSQNTSYVDDDGYTVTNRSANDNSSSKRKKKSVDTPSTLHQDPKRPPQRRKTQGTLEGFFKKSK